MHRDVSTDIYKDPRIMTNNKVQLSLKDNIGVIGVQEMYTLNKSKTIQIRKDGNVWCVRFCLF